MFHDKELKLFTGGEAELKSLNALTLAFIGDAVYELMIRQYMLCAAELRVRDLHGRTVQMANAGFQAQAVQALLPLLSEEEAGVYRRGRNAHSSHTPKNKSEAEYHKATGFEALFGYLYLAEKYDRLYELFDIAAGLYSENSLSAERQGLSAARR